MLVLSVAYPLFPVSADSGGGAEQILHLVERGLVEGGHHSIVIAAEGSRVSGLLVATPAAGENTTEDDRVAAQRTHLQAIRTVLTREAVDVIHFHGLDFHQYVPETTRPMIATLHLPISWYAPQAFENPGIALVCVSQSQAANLPLGSVATIIENGIEPIGIDQNVFRRNELMWLGRVCPEKGTHIALQVAHQLDLPLTVAGPVHGFAEHEAYFQREVQPLLDGRRRYVGPVNRQQKGALLRQVKALLIPSLVAETSSLVAMESLSAGTPVIAFRSGALPEIVEEGVNGFIVGSEEEMAAAVGKVDQLSMQGRSFEVAGMVAKYLALYKRAARSKHAFAG